jgi:acetoin utilization deacetylase AcuC-like enzyme
MSKFKDLHDYMTGCGIMSLNGPLYEPPHPLDKPEYTAAIYKTHCADYVHRFLSGKLTTAEMRRIGLCFNDGLIDRTMYELGGTIETVRLALQSPVGLACNLAGGTHHAHRDFGRGFTILNDIACAAHWALDNVAGVEKVVIFDCDVHQGDGTAALFRDDPRVFTCSVHAQDNWPPDKHTSNLDVGLLSGLEDEAYLLQVAQALELSFKHGRPDLVIYDAGCDISTSDRLGLLNVSDDGIERRDRLVLEECLKRGVPCACLIGGGYDAQEPLAAKHSLLFRAALDLTSQWS